MDDTLETVKAELERFGIANDAATTERPRRMLNITRDTGEFLAVLVRATVGRRILEVGTSHEQEMAPFVALVAADSDFTTCLVPVGKGEFLAVKT